MSLRTKLAREVRPVKVKLDTVEVAGLGVRLAEAMVERDKLDRDNAAEKKALGDEHSAARSEVTKRIDEARDAIVSGSRSEDVEVEDWADHEAGMVSTIRLDTSEVIGTRPMTEAEKQVPIDFVGPPPQGEGGTGGAA